MAIEKLLSFAGAGAIALSPFTLLAFSKEKIVSPIMKENRPQIKNSLERSTELSVIHSSGGAESSLASLKASRENSESISLIQSTNNKNQVLSNSQDSDLSSEDYEEFKLEANLGEWLNNINPSINAGEEVILIARGERGYFLLAKGDKECQCFLTMNDDVGIGTNGAGLFTIGRKLDNPHKSLVPSSENSKCAGFDSFGGQNGDTGRKLQSGLTTIETDKTSHKAIASCYKHPVVFLETNKLVPIFTRHKGYITPLVPMNYYYDYKAKKFPFPHLYKIPPKHSFNVRGYEDWKKLGNINGLRKN